MYFKKGGMFKMKKIMAVVAALAIMTVGTTAFAAESPSAGSTTVDPDETQEAVVGDVTKPTESVDEMAENTSATAEGLIIDSDPVLDQTVTEAVVEAKNAISNLSDLATAIEDENLKTVASDSTKKVNADVKAVVNLNVVEGTIPESGITLTIKNDYIEAGKTYVILHYNSIKNAWEYIKATNVKEHSLDIHVYNLSPVAIVEISVDDIVTQTGSADNATITGSALTTGTTTSSASADDTASSDSTSEGTSPKTGETTPLALIGLMVCVAGAFACAKKSQHN
jgi:hypothetical protein